MQFVVSKVKVIVRAAERALRFLATLVFGYDVFLSYARSDGEKYARAVQARLEATGLVTFVDYEGIPPGEVLRKAIARGLRRSRLLLVICSEAAIKSV